MNFFEQQDKARKRTAVLLFFYVLAVIGTIFSVYGVIRVSWYLFQAYSASRSSYSSYASASIPFQFWDSQSFLFVTGVVCMVVLIGTWTKIQEFSSGGSAVAEMLGGEQILPGTSDPEERKVLNVVEEMSIAAGVPVPPIFILKKEYSINAFAAGFSIQDAVIGVTQGAVKLLSRDELQGVIAHEFSHIFNGDMRLNMHLTGFLNGLLLIALTGKTILRGFSQGRVRSSGRGGGGAVLAIMVLAVLLLVVGYIGVFFCNWIKSCVSRQREFLADASSAQYTRNPAGLAGALKKIGGLADGSFVAQAKAEEVSHFFFADGVTLMSEPIFATHPPLGLRIKLLDPSFDGKYPGIKSITPPLSKIYQKHTAGLPAAKRVTEWERKIAIFQAPVAAVAQASLGDTLVSQVGVMTEASRMEAGRILERLPKLLREATMVVTGSEALIYGLLMDRVSEENRGRQREYLLKEIDPAVHQVFLKLLPEFLNLPIELCLPLLDLATPTLKTQTPEHYERFRRHVEALIQMDQVLTVFEFALKQVVLHHLDFFFGKVEKPMPVYASLGQVFPSCEILLSYLATAGDFSRPRAETAFMKAVKTLDASRMWKFIPQETVAAAQVEEALKTLTRVFPKCKEQFLRAAVICVEQDEKLEVAEMELLRAFASVLNCPLPPFSIPAIP